MSIQSDIITALIGGSPQVADGRVYPQAAPQNAALPLVVYRRVNSEPLMTLLGYAGTTKHIFVFECWASTYAAALSLADSVRGAIESAAALQPCYREQGDPDDYEPAVDQFVEPVLFSFWHST